MPPDPPIVAAAELSETSTVASILPDHEVTARTRLTRVIGPPSFSVAGLFSGFLTLVRYSDLLYVLSCFRLKVRYKQSYLGWAWALLQPLVLMGIYTFVFAHVTKVNTAGTPYSIFVLSGLLPWILFSSSIGNAVHGMVAHPGLLTKMYFPREIIPLSYLAPSIADFVVGLMILSGMLVHYHVAATWNLLYAIPLLIILAAFAAAISLFFSAVHVRFRDVGLALPFLLQVWMFATPVVYSLQAVPVGLRKWYMLDPAAYAIENFRQAVIYGNAPDVASLAAAAGIVFVALSLAYAYFKCFEGGMADVI